MAKRTKLLRKFKKPFVISGTKLCKINEMVMKRLDLIKGDKDIVQTFTVTLEKGRKHILTKIESVLELDNSMSNKIIEISVEWEIGKEEDDDRSAIFLNFDSDIDSSIYGNSIILAGQALDSLWLNETIAEIEEQVERTIQIDFISRIKSLPFFGYISGGIIAALFTILIIGSIELLGFQKSDILELTKENRNKLTELNRKISSTDDKINYIYTAISLCAEKKDTYPIKTLFKKPSTYFIISPIIFTMITFYYLITCCYPSFVFEWGDYGQHYQKLIERRKYLYSIIVGSLIIGIMANLFVFGISESVMSPSK